MRSKEVFEIYIDFIRAKGDKAKAIAAGLKSILPDPSLMDLIFIESNTTPLTQPITENASDRPLQVDEIIVYKKLLPLMKLLHSIEKAGDPVEYAYKLATTFQDMDSALHYLSNHFKSHEEEERPLDHAMNTWFPQRSTKANERLNEGHDPYGFQTIKRRISRNVYSNELSEEESRRTKKLFKKEPLIWINSDQRLSRIKKSLLSNNDWYDFDGVISIRRTSKKQLEIELANGLKVFVKRDDVNNTISFHFLENLQADEAFRREDERRAIQFICQKIATTSDEASYASTATSLSESDESIDTASLSNSDSDTSNNQMFIYTSIGEDTLDPRYKEIESYVNESFESLDQSLILGHRSSPKRIMDELSSSSSSDAIDAPRSSSLPLPEVALRKKRTSGLELLESFGRQPFKFRIKEIKNFKLVNPSDADSKIIQEDSFFNITFKDDTQVVVRCNGDWLDFQVETQNPQDSHRYLALLLSFMLDNRTYLGFGHSDPSDREALLQSITRVIESETTEKVDAMIREEVELSLGHYISEIATHKYDSLYKDNVEEIQREILIQTPYFLEREIGHVLERILKDKEKAIKRELDNIPEDELSDLKSRVLENIVEKQTEKYLKSKAMTVENLTEKDIGKIEKKSQESFNEKYKDNSKALKKKVLELTLESEKSTYMSEASNQVHDKSRAGKYDDDIKNFTFRQIMRRLENEVKEELMKERGTNEHQSAIEEKFEMTVRSRLSDEISDSERAKRQKLSCTKRIQGLVNDPVSKERPIIRSHTGGTQVQGVEQDKPEGSSIFKPK